MTTATPKKELGGYSPSEWAIVYNMSPGLSNLDQQLGQEGCNCYQ